MNIDSAQARPAAPSAAATFVHYDKRIDPAGSIQLGGVMLKWYDLARPETPVPDNIRRLAHLFLERQPRDSFLRGAGDLGFVILHRCEGDFYFMLVSTWRNGNEIWESVFEMDGEKQSDFQPFVFEQQHKGTFCVWELVAVWHERQAWKRYLLSGRGEAARQAYLQDNYRGPA